MLDITNKIFNMLFENIIKISTLEYYFFISS